MDKKLRQGTLCVQAGYKAKNGEPIELPIIQSTTFKYDDSDEMAKLFDLEKEGYFYTRLQNPTNDAVAAKIATLEGGVGAVLTSSGQAANFYAIFNICQAGDHFITSNEIYGGTYNLFGVTLKKLGIDCTFISQEASDEEIQAAFRPNTKAMFGETISNPGCAVFDIERFAKIAHKNGVPLIVDNTFATPVNCRPFEWGDWTMLGLVLLGNIIGCLLSAWLIAYAQPDCIEPASKILAGRLAKGPFACFLLAIGCGFIMTTAVEFARKGKMLPLLLGVPVFILCGFAHSIADAFYFLVSPSEQLLQMDVLIVYVSEVLGNFVGCNLYRWMLVFEPKEDKKC